MATWYMVKGGVIVNYIVADSAFVTAQVNAGNYDVGVNSDTISGTKPNIGWTYSGGIFWAPAPVSDTFILDGPTAGTITWTQDTNDNGSYVVMAAFNGYANAQASNQVISFPYPFANTPIITGNNTGVTLIATKTSLTIVSPQGASPFSGNVIVEGF